MTNLMDDWLDVAPSVDTRKSPFERTMEEASRIAVRHLLKEIPEEGLSLKGQKEISGWLTKLLTVFLDTWFAELRKGDLAALVEHIIAGQDLEPIEVESFARALPRSFLEKVAKTSGKVMNGYHLLFSMELHRRNGVVSGYSVVEDGGRKHIEFTHNDKDPEVEPQRIRVALDEEWEDPEEKEKPEVLTSDEFYQLIANHPAFKAMSKLL